MEQGMWLLLFTVTGQTVTALMRNSMDLMWSLTLERKWISLLSYSVYFVSNRIIHIVIIVHMLEYLVFLYNILQNAFGTS